MLEITVPAGVNTVVAASPVSGQDVIWRRLGIRIAAADAASVTQANPQLRGGVIIQEIDPDGVAAHAGMQRGDVLIGLHQFETLNPDNVTWILNNPDIANSSPLKFFLIRAGQVRRGTIPQVP